MQQEKVQLPAYCDLWEIILITDIKYKQMNKNNNVFHY